MRTFSIFAGALLMASVAFANTSTEELPADGYAAIVNARVITVGDVLEFVQAGDLQMRDEFAGTELARRRQEAYKNARDLLIEQALIVEDFKKLGGTIPDRVVDDRIKEFIFERFDNSRAKFLEALAEEQITLDEWRTRVRERLIVSILRRQEVTDRIKITPGALQKAYDGQLEKWKLPARIHVRLIALPLPESDDALKEEQRQIAIRARGRILTGEAFADVAREVSQDSKAAAGGDWGWRAPSDFSAELGSALEKLPTGEVSDIIETPAAIYLALVEGREAARQRTLDEVRPEIERSLRQAEAERLYSRWMERLKKKYFVQVF
ncbi:MAG: peptidyl-prolyl cis-trans isomerase [Kiritimatiellae bacterium]|nr:peptidyl-prolyl cis-trans isomerase [Kiritimatiellia bacterium]